MNTELSYIAGVIDGEGTLLVGKYDRGNKNLSYRGFMAITNTHVPLLEYIQKVIGGSITEQGKGKGCYSLSLTTNEIRKYLPQITPFLIVKQKQAEVLLAFLKKQADNSSAPVSSELLKFYDECYQKLKSMKKERFKYIRPHHTREIRKCKKCGCEYTWSSKNPKQLYCSVVCKKVVHYTRSNARIRAGIPAWNNNKAHGLQ